MEPQPAKTQLVEVRQIRFIHELLGEHNNHVIIKLAITDRP